MACGELPSELTRAQLCKLLDISPQALDKLERKGACEKIARGKYSIGVVAQLYHRMSEGAAGRRGDDDTVDLAKERGLLARAQREGHEQKNAITRGELLEAKAVENRWASILSAIRARMLALPTDIAQLLPHLTRHDVEVIDRAIRDALNEAADETGAD